MKKALKINERVEYIVNLEDADEFIEKMNVKGYSLVDSSYINWEDETKTKLEFEWYL
jgi:hypothetical protein